MDVRGRRMRRLLAALLPVLVFVLALVALHRLGGEFHLRDVLAEFAAIESWRVAAAVLLAGASYLALTGYERLALGYVGASMPWRRVARPSRSWSKCSSTSDAIRCARWPCPAPTA